MYSNSEILFKKHKCNLEPAGNVYQATEELHWELNVYCVGLKRHK